MIPTHISTLFLMPGYVMEDRVKNPVQFAEILPREDGNGFAWLDNEALGGFIYVPDRPEDKRVIKLEDIRVDAEGKLLEPVFAVTDIQSIQTGHARHGWATESMRETRWADLEYAIEPIHDIAKGHLDKFTAKEREWIDMYHDATVRFIGLWSAEGSTDWETGIWELDGFSFEGEGNVVLISAGSS